MFDEVNNDVRAAPEENKIGLGKIREWFQDAVDKSRDWRKEAKEDYRFVSGKQWKNADKEQLEKFGRPAITINKIKPLMNVLSGYQRLNRYDISFCLGQMMIWSFVKSVKVLQSISLMIVIMNIKSLKFLWMVLLAVLVGFGFIINLMKRWAMEK